MRIFHYGQIVSAVTARKHIHHVLTFKALIKSFLLLKVHNDCEYFSQIQRHCSHWRQLQVKMIVTLDISWSVTCLRTHETIDNFKLKHATIYSSSYIYWYVLSALIPLPQNHDTNMFIYINVAPTTYYWQKLYTKTKHFTWKKQIKSIFEKTIPVWNNAAFV